MIRSSDASLQRIADKLEVGERLDAADGLALFETPDLLGLGRLANAVKEQRSGPFVSFVLNRQVNPTNVCVLTCKFCDFATKLGDDDAYEMSLEQVRERVSVPWLREVHVVGGMHPDWPFERYLEILRVIREAAPQAQIKAYTAVEIDFFAHLTRLSVEEVLGRLQEAGLQTMPGGGAEVFSDRVRAEMYPEKMGHERWLEIHEIAHSLGIRTNSTLLYGHIETWQERVDHMLMLRDLQDRTGGFFSFIPLAFQLGYTNIVDRPASAIEDLKTIAAARLLLDNFAHIKAYWVMLGEDSASMALQFGADDLDGTIGEERIAHAALASSPVGLTVHRLVKLIREAGRLPLQRDAFYRALAVYPPPGHAVHWSQRLGFGDADPIPLRATIEEPAWVDVESEDVRTWDLSGPRGASVRALATTPLADHGDRAVRPSAAEAPAATFG